MKKLTSLLISCSLAIAGAALAQQPDEQQSPSKGKRAPEKTHATEAQPGANAARPQEKPAKQTGAVKERGTTNERAATNEPGAMKERGATTEPGAQKGRKGHAGRESANAPETNETNVSGEPTSGATNKRSATNEPGAEKGRKGHASRESANAPETNVSGQATTGTSNEPRTGKNRRERATQQSANAPTSGAKEQAEQQRKEQTEQQRKGVNAPATAAKTSASPAPAGTNAVAPSAAVQQNAQARGTGAAKKPAPQQVQQVKSQHANFRAQPKPQQVPAVTFNQNHRIEGSDRWQGQQYQVFRSYRPEWHDAGWYTSHYGRVELIGGGYYYFNNGYWFPAWGYNPSSQYYAYDGPIYAGSQAEPPDRVIADTQALLQQMGYYKGDVDGLLGPLTRQALAAYQASQGLATTSSIDQPTLDSLGLA